MQTTRRSIFSFVVLALALALAFTLLARSAHADQFVYVSLPQPGRLLDTRTGSGTGSPLTAAGSPYLFGTDNSSINNQHGSSTGCGIPAGIEAVSVNMNMLNTTAADNIATWNPDTGPTAPNIGTGVYNPSATNPVAGQVLYNTGYSSIPVGSGLGTNPGKFYLTVASGQIDMTINVVGYWLPVSWAETRVGVYANAFGYKTTASGSFATALGQNTIASGSASTAMGYQTQATQPASFALGQANMAGGYASVATGFSTTASGNYSTAMGQNTIASGNASTAIGYQSHADGPASFAAGQSSTGGYAAVALGSSYAAGSYSLAAGYQSSAAGNYSVAMGNNANANTNGSFAFCDSTCTSPLDVVLSVDNYFTVLASGSAEFITSAASVSPRTGVYLNNGSGSWGGTSDRNAKTAERQIDARDVLARIVAMPVITWQYKTQETRYRHMGPMAQDFYAAFHLGERDTIIDTVDEGGVALAAIQDLNAQLEEKDACTSERFAEKDREIAAVRADKDREIAALKAKVDSLESVAADVSELKAQLAALCRTPPSAVTVALQP